MPQRLQQSRQQGWRKPAGAVVVSRPSRWGNPYTVAQMGSAQAACERYERSLWELDPAARRTLLAPLCGKDLLCWCARGTPCHGDILLRWANTPALWEGADVPQSD